MMPFMFAGSVAVMSIDLGSEWMKMAIVKPGVPMEIVLNKYALNVKAVEISNMLSPFHVLIANPVHPCFLSLSQALTHFL